MQDEYKYFKDDDDEKIDCDFIFYYESKNICMPAFIFHMQDKFFIKININTIMNDLNLNGIERRRKANKATLFHLKPNDELWM